MINELVFRIIFAILWLVFIFNILWVRYQASAHGEKAPPDQAAIRERRLHAVGLAIFGPLWFGGVYLYLLLPSWIAFFSIPLPDWFRVAMAGVSAISIPFTIWGYRALGRNWVHALDQSQFRLRKEERLVTSGPYRYVRNPIYLGAFTLVISLSLLSANAFLFVPTVFIVTLIYMQIDGEETMLTAKFGDEYREYMKRTPRIIPRLGRDRSTHQEA